MQHSPHKSWIKNGSFLQKDYAHTLYMCVYKSILVPFPLFFFYSQLSIQDGPNGWLPALNLNWSDWKSLALSLWLSCCIIDRCSSLLRRAVQCRMFQVSLKQMLLWWSANENHWIATWYQRSPWLNAMCKPSSRTTASSIQNTCYEVFTSKSAVLKHLNVSNNILGKCRSVHKILW